MYTPAEISTIKDLFEKLVSEKRINIELDAFGDPVQRYSRDAMNQLTIAIKRLPSFPRKDVVENAMLEVSTDWQGEIFAATCGDISEQVVKDYLYASVAVHINDAALCEISEHLFTTKQIQAMLRQHPDYLSTRESDIRIGRLEREELEDLKRLETGIQTQSEFNKTFEKVA